MKHIVKVEIDNKRYGILEEVFNCMKQCCNKINELEEENKKLKSAMQDTYDSANDTCGELQQRIDKAIEFIEETKCVFGTNLDMNYLLKILRGEE